MNKLMIGAALSLSLFVYGTADAATSYKMLNSTPFAFKSTVIPSVAAGATSVSSTTVPANGTVVGALTVAAPFYSSCKFMGTAPTGTISIVTDIPTSTTPVCKGKAQPLVCCTYFQRGSR